MISLKFTRINDNSIRCLITKEEMTEQGINLDELMDDRSKAEEFLRIVLQQARYELGFETTGEALNVQLSVMKDGDVSLMISDDQNAAIRAMLSQFKERLKEFTEAMEQTRKQSKAAVIDADKSAKAILGTSTEDKVIDMDIWAELELLDDCIRLAKALDLPDTPSTLLKYHDTYYLTMRLSQTRHDLVRSVFSIAEFSINMYTEGPATYGVAEHGKRIIKENALKELAAF